MKVAIISDVHNNTTNLKKVLDYCIREKIETIICCGDLASEETLEFLSENFSGKIYYTFGNMDNDQLKNFEALNRYKNVKLYKNFGEIKIDEKLVAFTHYPDLAKELCATGKYQLVFYGHTHKPWEETINNCKMLNPGNVAGEIYPPTFAVWDTTKNDFALIRIHELGK
jgi:putative phosphoesterase